MDSFDYIKYPILECLVLVGIHSYLGIHVIRRKVIFVDLALAQLAALGATVGFLFGIMPETPAAFIFSIVFAAAGAGVFATTRMRSERVPHEAVIGLVYAIAAAVAIMVIDKAPSGAEHLKNVLVGRIEWVLGHEVLIAAIVYSIVGLVHWWCRRPFYMISEHPEEAYARGMRVRAWDFLFYLTFGVVISVSVKVAGVLLVFVFLVVPAIAAVLITDNHLYQLLVGWGLGVIVTVVGMLVSYHAALPSGPTVVSTYGVVLVIVAVVLYLIRSKDRVRSLGRVLAGAAAVGAFGGLVFLLGHGLQKTSLGHASHHHPREMVDPRGAPHEHDQTPSSADDPPAGQGAAAHAGGEGPSRTARHSEPLEPEEVLSRAEERVHGAERVAALSSLLDMLRDDEIGVLYKEQALHIIETEAGKTFGFDPDADESEAAAALDAIDAWIHSLE